MKLIMVFGLFGVLLGGCSTNKTWCSCNNANGPADRLECELQAHQTGTLGAVYNQLDVDRAYRECMKLKGYYICDKP